MTESIPLTESEAAKVAAFGIDHPSTVKTETEIRVWREELREEFEAHDDIPSIAVACQAAIDVLTWVLGEAADV